MILISFRAAWLFKRENERQVDNSSIIRRASGILRRNYNTLPRPEQKLVRTNTFFYGRQNLCQIAQAGIVKPTVPATGKKVPQGFFIYGARVITWNGKVVSFSKVPDFLHVLLHLLISFFLNIGKISASSEGFFGKISASSEGFFINGFRIVTRKGEVVNFSKVPDFLHVLLNLLILFVLDFGKLKISTGSAAKSETLALSYYQNRQSRLYKICDEFLIETEIKT